MKMQRILNLLQLLPLFILTTHSAKCYDTTCRGTGNEGSSKRINCDLEHNTCGLYANGYPKCLPDKYDRSKSEDVEYKNCNIFQKCEHFKMSLLYGEAYCSENFISIIFMTFGGTLILPFGIMCFIACCKAWASSEADPAPLEAGAGHPPAVGAGYPRAADYQVPVTAGFLPPEAGASYPGAPPTSSHPPTDYHPVPINPPGTASYPQSPPSAAYPSAPSYPPPHDSVQYPTNPASTTKQGAPYSPKVTYSPCPVQPTVSEPAHVNAPPPSSYGAAPPSYEEVMEK